MSKRNERMQKLNGAGINVNKYFNIDLPNGLKPGAKIQIIIDENGEPTIVNENNAVFSNDYIANQIITDGYVRNTKLHRRWVMAQMFHMLNYESWRGNDRGYHACLNSQYSYDYTLEMMLEEVKVLSKLEERDVESFEERSHFFTKAVVVAVLTDYMEKLHQYIEHLPEHKCKGVPYKRVKGVDVFNTDIDRRFYAPLRRELVQIRDANGYAAIYNHLRVFMRNAIKLPYNTAKSKAWIDAFKGEGAYYTLKNLIMFHECGISDKNYRTGLYGIDAMNYINAKLNEYQNEGWRMFALMKKVISDNDFDFNKRMEEIYS